MPVPLGGPPASGAEDGPDAHPPSVRLARGDPAEPGTQPLQSPVEWGSSPLGPPSRAPELAAAARGRPRPSWVESTGRRVGHEQDIAISELAERLDLGLSTIRNVKRSRSPRSGAMKLITGAHKGERSSPCAIVSLRW